MTDLTLGPVLRHVGTDSATVWVETDRPCVVDVLGHEQRTFAVAGHHYALVQVRGLAPGSSTPYEVRLDGERVWPPAGSDHPPSRIRTLEPGRPVRVAFGSCRYATGPAVGAPKRYGVDAMDAFAVRTAHRPEETWPDLLLMLGDQVYADDTSAETQDRIRARRDISEPPGAQVRDFEEYTWLYHESWTDPEIRWLMSTVPIAMIFDDHDVHDDWNTSRAWRAQMQDTSWWQERITGGLMSYWIYQHLGNLSPDELAADQVHAAVMEAAASGADVEPVLRDFAARADREADGAKGYRWSYYRDLGDTRLVVLDSRCGRILDGPSRSMLSDAEFAWLEQQLEGEYDHLLVGTSVPWLLAPALHAIESWNERMAERDGRSGRVAEKLRQGTDLEHWAAFHDSFERLARLLGEVASGRRGGRVPASVCVLSGDVHHTYVAEADYGRWPEVGELLAPVHQLTCSPVHNWVPAAMRWGFRVSWSRAAERAVRFALGRIVRLPDPPIDWHRVHGLVRGNAIATLLLDRRTAQVVIESSRGSDPRAPLVTALAVDLTPAPMTAPVTT